jgi:hypothetical protein
MEGHLGGRHVESPGEHNRACLGCGQPRQTSPNLATALFNHAPPLGIACFGGRARCRLRSVNRCRPFRPHPVQCEVASDSGNPCVERAAFRVDRRTVSPDALPRHLNDIFGRSRIANNPKCQPIQSLAEVTNEVRGTLFIASAKSFQKKARLISTHRVLSAPS